MDSHKLLVEDMSSSSMLENEHIKTLCQIYHTTAFTSYYKLLSMASYVNHGPSYTVFRFNHCIYPYTSMPTDILLIFTLSSDTKYAGLLWVQHSANQLESCCHTALPQQVSTAMHLLDIGGRGLSI